MEINAGCMGILDQDGVPLPGTAKVLEKVKKVPQLLKGYRNVPVNPQDR